MASNYETAHELLGSLSTSECPINDFIGGERIPVLPWVPCTTSAVALRLMELDACIFYTSRQKLESEKDKKIGIVVVSILCSLTFLVNNGEKVKEFNKNKVEEFILFV